MACSCVLPLLSFLTKHMTANYDDPGYIARFKVASVNDFSECVADVKSVEILKIATAFDPRYKFFAMTVLCMPVNSVPCERLNSSAVYVVNNTCSSLEPNTVDLLMCLHRWLSNYIYAIKRLFYFLF